MIYTLTKWEYVEFPDGTYHYAGICAERAAELNLPEDTKICTGTIVGYGEPNEFGQPTVKTKRNTYCLAGLPADR